ncbi:MAG: hypothetical protein BWY75_00171 [bacterium ADurb.Bin425]|jgi:hypothetical protein|nr:MAG: hypothetical protein BWY75_00171 [bacterium ADurb.Bin425]
MDFHVAERNFQLSRLSLKLVTLTLILEEKSQLRIKRGLVDNRYDKINPSKEQQKAGSKAKAHQI